jgi:hypothetical protein
MKMRKFLIIIFVCCAFSRCITEYEPKNLEGVSGILVVEGIITDYQSVITLTQTISISGTDTEHVHSYDVSDARVWVETSDGYQWKAIVEHTHTSSWSEITRYIIENEKLDVSKLYRLRIEIDQYDCSDIGNVSNWVSSSCPKQTFEYLTDFSYPIVTPPIDSVFWRKSGRGEPVMLYAATGSQDGKLGYYKFSFKEDWEVNSAFNIPPYPFRCWNAFYNRELLLASSERTVNGKVIFNIFERSPSNHRFSVLYRLDVQQNAISKRAFDYFENIKKNSQLTGDIFAPVPSELRGNIVCSTEPSRPVIGYVDVSTTVHKRLYILPRDVYEPINRCQVYLRDTLLAHFDGNIPTDWYIPLFSPPPPEAPNEYVTLDCVDCRFIGGEQKPDDW